MVDNDPYESTIWYLKHNWMEAVSAGSSAMQRVPPVSMPERGARQNKLVFLREPEIGGSWVHCTQVICNNVWWNWASFSLLNHARKLWIWGQQFLVHLFVTQYVWWERAITHSWWPPPWWSRIGICNANMTNVKWSQVSKGWEVVEALWSSKSLLSFKLNCISALLE